MRALVCRLIKYLKRSLTNGDMGSFTDISEVWALLFNTADIWAGNLGNSIFQGGMKVFPGKTFFQLLWAYAEHQ